MISETPSVVAFINIYQKWCSEKHIVSWETKWSFEKGSSTFSKDIQEKQEPKGGWWISSGGRYLEGEKVYKGKRKENAKLHLLHVRTHDVEE